MSKETKSDLLVTIEEEMQAGVSILAYSSANKLFKNIPIFKKSASFTKRFATEVKPALIKAFMEGYELGKRVHKSEK